MIPQHTGADSYKIPACKRKHLPDKSGVKDRSETTLLEVASAVHSVSYSYYQHDHGHQGGVTYKTVKRGTKDEEGHHQAKKTVEKSDAGICGHTLVSRDARHLRHAEQVYDK